MAKVPNVKALQSQFDRYSSGLRAHFKHFAVLVPQCPYEVVLAYLFLRTEAAHNSALYLGLIRIRRAHKDVASSVVERQHMAQEKFSNLFHNVYGKALDEDTVALLRNAQKVRNRVVHGKLASDAEMREAIADVLEYANRLDQWILREGGFTLFGNHRGIVGNREPLDKVTTQWLMKGMGFFAS